MHVQVLGKPGDCEWQGLWRQTSTESKGMMEQGHEADTNPENSGDGGDDEQGIMTVEEIKENEC